MKINNIYYLQLSSFIDANRESVYKHSLKDIADNYKNEALTFRRFCFDVYWSVDSVKRREWHDSLKTENVNVLDENIFSCIKKYMRENNISNW